ncbi:ABC transporter substrate-binding protein [Shouchella shacheensis]|uniref:ABC transporter substrate-binding protein n=1 Tax=Shouchella shacheensis TaxID=1649580 RepID=UPI0007405614|nr:sugar ABC transporter substrate-binding protein [Shouchella shacheensis]
MIRRVCQLGSVLMFSTALAACSTETETETESVDSQGVKQLTFSAWGNPAEQEVYQRAVDEFNEMHDDVEVSMTGIPADSYFRTIMTRLQGGQAPDVFYVGAENISTLIGNETIVELSDFLETDASHVTADEFPEDIWGAAKQDDQIYGLSVDSNPMLMYYNKTLLENAGVKSPQEHYEEGNWNWETFEQVTGQLRDAGYYGFVQEGGHADMLSWVWTNGGEFSNENDEIVADQDERTLEALEYVHRMVQENHFIFAGTLPQGQGGDAMFVSNQVGFVAAGRWLTPLFSESNLEFDYIPWPTNTGNQMEPANIATAYIAANQESDHLEEAMQFISYYASQEGQSIRLEDDGNAVPSVEGIEDIVTEAQVPEHSEYLIEARDIGNVISLEYQAAGLDVDLADIYEIMLIGDMEPEEAVEQAADLSRLMLETE